MTKDRTVCKAVSLDNFTDRKLNIQQCVKQRSEDIVLLDDPFPNLSE